MRRAELRALKTAIEPQHAPVNFSGRRTMRRLLSQGWRQPW